MYKTLTVIMCLLLATCLMQMSAEEAVMKLKGDIVALADDLSTLTLEAKEDAEKGRIGGTFVLKLDDETEYRGITSAAELSVGLTIKIDVEGDRVLKIKTEM